MKVSTLASIMATLSTVDFSDKDAILSELASEYEKAEKAETAKAAKAETKAAAYADAHEVFRKVMQDAEGATVTCAEIFDSGEDEWPEGFTKSKLQYALRVYWGAEVVKHPGKVMGYTLA